MLLTNNIRFKCTFTSLETSADVSCNLALVLTRVSCCAQLVVRKMNLIQYFFNKTESNSITIETVLYKEVQFVSFCCWEQMKCWKIERKKFIEREKISFQWKCLKQWQKTTSKHKSLQAEGNRWSLITSSSSCLDCGIKKMNQGQTQSGLMLTFSCFFISLCASTCLKCQRRQVCQAEWKLQRLESDGFQLASHPTSVCKLPQNWPVSSCSVIHTKANMVYVWSHLAAVWNEDWNNAPINHLYKVYLWH